MRQRSLLIEDRRRGLSGGEGKRQGCRGRNDYMCGGTQGASGVRYFGRRMYVGDLQRGAENQQESAAKNQGDLPGTSREIFSLPTAHHLQL
jgi:hypothetical protein